MNDDLDVNADTEEPFDTSPVVRRPDAVTPYDPDDPEWQDLESTWNDRWVTAADCTLPPPEFVIELYEQVRAKVTSGFRLAAFVTQPPYTWVDYAVHLGELAAVLGTERITIGPMPERDEHECNIPGTADPYQFVVRYRPVDPDAELMRLVMLES